MTTETLAALESLRVAPNSEAAKFVWSYAQRNAHPHSKAPVACAALLPDMITDPESDGEHKLVGFGVGFSYCSNTDVPECNEGRRRARSRSLVAIKTMSGFRSRYGQTKTAFDGNNEPYQTGHVKFVYIPCGTVEETEKVINQIVGSHMLPDDEQLVEGIRRYVNNAIKHGKL